jgi:hypothetical protein
MAPSTTIGAVILLRRKAATKVIVSHYGHRKVRTAPDVLVQTNRAGGRLRIRSVIANVACPTDANWFRLVASFGLGRP